MGDESQENIDWTLEFSAAGRPEIFHRAQNIAADLKI